MMKKQLLLLVMMLLPIVAWAADVEIDGIYYKFNSQTRQAEVTVNPNSYKGEVVIPETVYHSTILYSVTSIGKNAFQECIGLTSITIPNSVTSIGGGAFSQSRNLTSVTIGNGVKTIGEGAFWLCRGLTSVTIGNSVTSIEKNAFEECSALTSITIPNSVTSIGGGAFSRCSALTSITIGNSVTKIGIDAFSECEALTSVYISDLEAWCNIPFYYPFPKSNPLYYADHLYLKGSEITNLVIPNSVTSIGQYAFSRCSGLTSVTIPSSVTTIGDYAFSECDGLTSITIPDSEISIGKSAFYKCTGLTSITIPDSEISIGTSAFNGCNGLTSITIPSSVTSIGKNAFVNCNNLTEVISMIENPFDISTYTFSDDTFSNATLYVPVGTIEKYKAKEGWKEFKNIIEGGNSVAQVGANAVLIQSESGRITVNGADDGTDICVYSTNGVLCGTAISHNGNAVVNPPLQAGSVAIVKFGDKSVRVVIR